MQAWLAGHAADLAAVVAPYFPDVAQEVLGDALRRYGHGGVWAASPAMSRAGFDRLGDSFLSGGALSRLPSFEACVATAFG
jgi:NitT/TauT family transport system substrate-binding protein